MIDNGITWSSDSSEIIYKSDFIYVHKDIEKVTTEDGATVYKCHEYKYPVMEYIELMKNQADATEQRAAVLYLQVSNLQSEV